VITDCCHTYNENPSISPADTDAIFLDALLIFDAVAEGSMSKLR
jgi:hypothetical protein